MAPAAAIEEVLRRWPDLSYRGMPKPKPEGPERKGAEVIRRKRDRDELLDPIVLAQFELCRDFVSALGAENPHGDPASSTELKRLLERWHMASGQPVYVHHSVIIIAMLAAGFTPREITPPSCSFAINPARLTALRRIGAAETAPPSRNGPSIRSPARERYERNPPT